MRKEGTSFKTAAVWTVSEQMMDACSVPAAAELILHFFSLHATAVQCANCVTLALEIKEHRSRRRLELWTRGLKTNTADGRGCVSFQVPRSGADECANAVFLRENAVCSH